MSISFSSISVFLWHETAVIYSLHEQMNNESNTRQGIVYHQAQMEPIYPGNTMPQYQIKTMPQSTHSNPNPNVYNPVNQQQ